MSEFYTITTPRAAKPYKCEECRRAIPKGERYCRHSGKQEGYVFSVVVCERCQGMRNAAWDLEDFYGEEGPVFGDLRNYLAEEHGITDADAWYDRILAERVAQRRLQGVLGDALRAYQMGSSCKSADAAELTRDGATLK